MISPAARAARSAVATISRHSSTGTGLKGSYEEDVGMDAAPAAEVVENSWKADEAGCLAGASDTTKADAVGRLPTAKVAKAILSSASRFMFGQWSSLNGGAVEVTKDGRTASSSCCRNADVL